jgi:hypothetical protein
MRELAGLVLDASVAEIDRQKRFAPFGRRLRRPPTKITDRRRRVRNAEKFGDVVRVKALDRAIAGLNLWGVHGVRRNGRDGQKTHQAHYSDRVSRKPSYPRTFQHADLPVLVRRTGAAHGMRHDMSAAGPTLPTSAVEQVGSYLGYTGNGLTW